MDVHEVYDVVSNMKQLAEKEPDKAKQMLVSHPQVSHPKVAEALLHMQVRLGMLKAEDIPSLQGNNVPPGGSMSGPPVVGGAIMLGKGAQLPILVPPPASGPAPFPPPAAPTLVYPSSFQPPPQPRQHVTDQANMWSDVLQPQVSPASSQSQFLQHQPVTQQQDYSAGQQSISLQPTQQQAGPPPPPPPPPPPLTQLQQPPQAQWGSSGGEAHGGMGQQGVDMERSHQRQQNQKAGFPSATADPREPRDPRNRYSNYNTSK
ncbi:unnamed protein product [Discosporangium mesarthrocarpum]